MMVRSRLLLLAFGLMGPLACEQYHPTAPAHIRPASERDRDFAAKVGEDLEKRKIVNTIETRAGGIVEPWLAAREDLVLWRLSVAGPVAVAEGVLDGRAFAAVLWTRDDRVVRRREMLGAPIEDPQTFAPTGRTRMRAAGDTQNLVRARTLISGKEDPPARVRFSDGATGRSDGGATALREALGAGVRITDGWCIDDVVALLSTEGLYVVTFEESKIVEVALYPR